MWCPIPPCGAEFIRVAPNSFVWRPIPPKSRAITHQSRPPMTNMDPKIEIRSGTLIASGQAARPTDAWIGSGQWDVSVRWQSPSVSLASGGRHLPLLKIASVRPPSCVIGPRWQLIAFDDNARNPVIFAGNQRQVRS